MTNKDNKKDNLNMVDDFLNMSKAVKDPKDIIENSKSFFGDLMNNIESMVDNKDYDKLESTFKTISQKLQNELESISAKYGVSVEEMQKLINDPKNFKQEDWNSLQDLKDQIEPDKTVKQAQKVNKLKNKNNWTAV